MSDSTRSPRLALARAPRDRFVVRPLWALVSLAAISFAAAAVSGFIPGSWVVGALLGPLVAAAWCTGAFAFACAVGPDTLPADLAIKHHQARREEARAERRRAA